MKNNKKKTLKGAESLPPVIAYNSPTNTNYVSNNTVSRAYSSAHDFDNRNSVAVAVKQTNNPVNHSANSSIASAVPYSNKTNLNDNISSSQNAKQRNSVFKLVGDSNSKRIVLRDKNFKESISAQSNDFSKLQNEKTSKNSVIFQKDGKTFSKTIKNSIWDDYLDYYDDYDYEYKPNMVLEDGKVVGLGHRPSPLELARKNKRSWAIVDVNSLYGKKQKKNKKKNTNKLNYLKNSVRKMF